MIFTAALLHSRTEENPLFQAIKRTIAADEVLSKGLHLVCSDNNYARNLLSYNSIKVDRPVFVLKYPEKEVETFALSQHHEVFNQIYQVHNNFNSFENRLHFIAWNLTMFPNDGQGLSIKVKQGDYLNVVSTDQKVHNVTAIVDRRTYCLIVDRKDIKETITINRKPGVYYLVCTNYPTRMRLRVEVIGRVSPPSFPEDQGEITFTRRKIPRMKRLRKNRDILQGITSYLDKEPVSKMTYAQRRAARRESLANEILNGLV